VNPAREAVDLQGVPETLLWTLYQRASEARRADAVIDDPDAVCLLDAIAYPFEQRFGRPRWAQAQALRARCFDDAVRDFLAVHPDGIVVALGEGLETQFRRVDNGAVRWVSVDLPQVIELRARLLPTGPRVSSIPVSALNECWIDAVAGTGPVFITAQGLFMYLPLADVRGLIAACARRLPGAILVFDAVPRWLSAATMRPKTAVRGYRIPPMPWGMDADGLVSAHGLHPSGTTAVELKPPRGRGLFFGSLMPWLNRVRPLRRLRTPIFPWTIVRLSFPRPERRRYG
jgi:O-methyltransferase involved in polyketide biosynthesis